METKTFLIVGLGNPGQKYELTRHNIGFLAVDQFKDSINGSDYKEEKKALVSKAQFKNNQVIIVKPQTFMNLSGESVQALMTFYKIQKKDILVVQDDLAMPFGAIRFFYDRSPGGHNGIKNIHEKIGADYSRMKIGILAEMGPIPVDRFVLMNFEPQEQNEFNNLFEYTNKGIMAFLALGHDQASNKFNRKQGLFS
jgi:peptidyl-tRNA hydrolase, PTH1 family